MKHPGIRPDRSHSPEDIARQVRVIVEAAIQATGDDFSVAFAERIERFAEALALWGAKTNLTAHPEDPSEVAFHILDSLAPLTAEVRHTEPAVRECFAAGKRVLDLGSGAGFPGLILAAACDARFTLVEARRRRASFLNAAATAMGLRNIVVEAVHATPSTVAKTFDAVVSRAVGESQGFFEIASAALRPGGIAIMYANPGQPFDMRRAVDTGLDATSTCRYFALRGRVKTERALLVFRRR